MALDRNGGGVTRRTFVKGGLAASALAALAACGKNTPSNSGDSTVKATDGGTFKYYISDPVAIDPYNLQESEGTQVAKCLFDSLTKYNYDTKELEPAAAESWESNDDATQWTFHIRKDCKFHNGDTVKAEDFKRGFERICDPTMKTPSDVAYHLDPVKGATAMQAGEADEISGVTCPDDYTLVFDLITPMSEWPLVCAHQALVPVPKAARDDPDSFLVAPIGNGPFQMDGTWVSGQYINVKKFDDYYGDKAKIDGIHFQVIKDMETAYKEFQAGNLDVCDVPVAQIDAAKKDRGVSKDGYTMGDGERMLLGAEPSTYYLTCNITAEPFNNADLRRGISLAINREAICKTIFKGTRTPADGIVPPGIDGYKEGAWEFCAYDVDKANEYLDKVAPAGANGDRGISVTLSYNQDGGHKEIMESIIGDLAKVGVTAVSDTPEWSALLEQYQNFNYQFGRLGWIADYPIMDNFLYPLFHSDSLGGDNRSGYNNPEFDAKVDEARTIVDDEERVAKMQEADAMVAADCPVIPIMFYTHTIAGSDRIKHLYVDPQKHADLGTAELA